MRWGLLCGKTVYLSRESIKADWIILRRSAASNGLYRNSTAPSSIAVCRTSALWCADIRITGSVGRSSLMRRCNSRPSIPGIRTSLITHVATGSVPDCRNSSADENTTGAYPADSSRLAIDSRIRKSSSTAATIGIMSLAIVRGVPNTQYRQRRRMAIIGLFRRPSGTGDSELVGHSDKVRERFSSHFSHDLAPVNSDRDLAGTQIGAS